MTPDDRRASGTRSDRDARRQERASEKPDEYRLAENPGDGGGTVAEREYEEYVLAERDADREEPDVLLDVPVVKVDEIDLEVDELRARVSLEADVLSLLRLHVGVDAFIGQVKLKITGVDAQALLKVRLANVARILDRVMTTIDRNPQLLERLVEGTGQAIAELGEGAGTAAEDVGEGAGSAVEGTGEAVEDVGQRAGEAVGDTGRTATRTAQGAGRTARKAASGADGKQRSRTRRSQVTKRSQDTKPSSRQRRARDPDSQRRSR